MSYLDLILNIALISGRIAFFVSLPFLLFGSIGWLGARYTYAKPFTKFGIALVVVLIFAVSFLLFGFAAIEYRQQLGLM